MGKWIVLAEVCLRFARQAKIVALVGLSSTFMGCDNEMAFRPIEIESFDANCAFWGFTHKEGDQFKGFRNYISKNCQGEIESLTCNKETITPDPAKFFPFCVQSSCESSGSGANTMRFTASPFNWGDPRAGGGLIMNFKGQVEDTPRCNNMDSSLLAWTPANGDPMTVNSLCLCAVAPPAPVTAHCLPRTVSVASNPNNAGQPQTCTGNLPDTNPGTSGTSVTIPLSPSGTYSIRCLSTAVWDASPTFDCPKLPDENFTCTGQILQNAIVCTNNTTPAVATVYGAPGSCPSPGGPCRTRCKDGFTYDGSSCQPSTHVCAGTRPDTSSAHACGNTSPSPDSVAYALKASCGTSTSQCWYECNSTHNFNGTACVAPTYSCTGTNPSSSTTEGCGTTALTVNKPYTLSGSCSGTTVCDFKCKSPNTWNGTACVAPTYSCTGTNPSSSTTEGCGTTALTANKPYTLSGSCSGTTVCDFKCKSPNTWDGSSCVLPTYSCTGTNPSSSTTEGCGTTALTANKPYTLSGSCSGTTVCDFKCKSPNTWDGSSCVPPTYSCTGTQPDLSSTESCGSTTNPTSNTNYRIFEKQSCPTSGQTKCDYRCKQGFKLSGATCVEEQVEVITGLAYCREYQMDDGVGTWGCGNGTSASPSSWYFVGAALSGATGALCSDSDSDDGLPKYTLSSSGGGVIGFTCVKTVGASQAGNYPIKGGGYCNTTAGRGGLLPAGGCGDTAPAGWTPGTAPTTTYTWRLVGKAVPAELNNGNPCKAGSQVHKLTINNATTGFACVSGSPSYTANDTATNSLAWRQVITGIGYCGQNQGTPPTDLHCGTNWKFFGDARSGVGANRCVNGSAVASTTPSKMVSGGDIGFICQKGAFALSNTTAPGTPKVQASDFKGGGWCSPSAQSGGGVYCSDPWQFIGNAIGGEFCPTGSTASDFVCAGPPIGVTCDRYTNADRIVGYSCK